MSGRSCASRATDIAEALDAVVHDQSAQAAARRFAAAIAALGAGESATDEVEQLGRRVLARGISN